MPAALPLAAITSAILRVSGFQLRQQQIERLDVRHVGDLGQHDDVELRARC